MRVVAKRSGSHVLMTVVGILTHWQSPGSVGALRSGVTCLLPEDGGDFHPLIIIGYTGGGGNERLNFGWGGDELFIGYFFRTGQADQSCHHEGGEQVGAGVQ